MSLFDQIFGRKIAAEPVVRADAVEKAVAAAVAIDQDGGDFVLFIFCLVVRGIGAEDDDAVERAALCNVDVALTGIGARKDELIARTTGLQL